MKIEIKHRITDAVLFAHDVEGNTIAATLKAAIESGADLGDAYLGGAYLGGANLGGADLGDIKSDFAEVLAAAQNEVPALRQAIVEGRIDGSVYQGECACLVGTIANIRGCNYQQLDGITPKSWRPAERWFLAIRKGDTPANNQVAAITLAWIDELYPTASEQGAAA